MSSYVHTAKDIIALHKKYNVNSKGEVEYGHLLDIDLTKVRTSKSKEHQNQYVDDLLIKSLDGSYKTLILKFNNQLLFGSAKISPFKKSDPSKIKEVNITFRELTKEDLKQTDYEDHLGKLHDTFIESSRDFIKAITIICEEYEALIKKLLVDKTNKTIKFKTRTTGTPLQCWRLLTDQEKEQHEKGEFKEEVKENAQLAPICRMDKPLFRPEIPVDVESKRLGVHYKSEKMDKFVEIVFDAEKTSQSKNKTAVPARVVTKDAKKKDIIEPLNLDNFNKFLTNMSCTTGEMRFPVVFSSKNNSLHAKVKEIYVLSHKRKVREAISETDMQDFSAIMSSMIKVEEPNDGDNSDNASHASHASNDLDNSTKDDVNESDLINANDEPEEVETKNISKKNEESTKLETPDDDIANNTSDTKTKKRTVAGKKPKNTKNTAKIEDDL